MSPEERQLLNALFDRVATAAATPRDADAERLIADAVRREPAAPYYLAQAVIVQEKGLEAASRRITELEARIRDLESQAAAPPQEERGGFLSSIFGSSQPPRAAPRPQAPVQPAAAGPWGAAQPAYGAPQGYGAPQAYAPPPAAGPWSQQQQGLRAPSAGSSFLTGALGTAAGVAGGMLLANSLSGIFGHHMSGLGLGNPMAEGFGGGMVEETVINNYYGDAAGDPGQDWAAQDAAGGNDVQNADLPPDDGLQPADDTFASDWSVDDSDYDGDDSSFA